MTDTEILAAVVSHRRAADLALREEAFSKLPSVVALERARKAAEVDGAQMHSAVRAAEAAMQTEELDVLVERLRTLLAETKPIELDFDAAKFEEHPPVFDEGGLGVEEPPPVLELPAEPPGFLARVSSKSRERHAAAVAEAQRSHERALAEYSERQEARQRKIAETMAENERAAAEVTARNVERNRTVDSLRSRIEAGEHHALAAYFAALLAASDYPASFPRKATVALDVPGRLFVVDYELPSLEVIPSMQAVRYDPRSDSFEHVPRPASRRKDLYGLVVASVALRSVRELFEADRSRVFDLIAFNGYVHGIDKVTGDTVRPYLVSFRTSREEFRLLDIVRTDPIVSMRTIEAAFSTNPAELAPVREVIGVRSLGPGAAMASSPSV
ncbi:MAG: hypothetical protein ACYDCC_05970 [Actinomycetota bacterium]